MTTPGDYVDETHQRISEFAEEFLEDDEERGAFVDGLMERHGYQRTSHWAPPEPQGGGQGGRQPLLRPAKAGGARGASRGAQGAQGGQRSYFKK